MTWISAKSRFSYLSEIAGSFFLLAIIHFVFVQLWSLSFKNGAESKANTMQGFSLEMMLWYFVGTETLIYAMPPIHRWYERDVRDGDLSMRLNKPITYLGFQWSQFFGEYLVRAIISLIVGGTVVTALIGGFSFSVAHLPVVLTSFLLAMIMNFCWSTLIGLTAFWTEDVSGAFFVLDRLKWLLGGFLLPVSLFPEGLQAFSQWLPFQYMIYAPARLMVQYDSGYALHTLSTQAFWCLPLVGAIVVIYQFGVRRVSVNGG